MKNPNPVNLQTSDEIKSLGWQAESRDSDGHLMSTHVPFKSDKDSIVCFVLEETERGHTVTIWPHFPE